MFDCGHACCAIRRNPYHGHLDPPSSCPDCRAMAAAGGRCRHTPRAGAPSGPGPHAEDVPRIAARVLDRYVPEITGLPEGAELDRLVLRRVLAAYLDALDDPLLAGAGGTLWRATVAGRVGVTLAFGDAASRRVQRV